MSPDDTQPLGPDPMVLYYRRLQQAVDRIHASPDLDHLMAQAGPEACTLLGADRVTLYLVCADGRRIASRVKTGLQASREIELPIGAQSIAGYVALSRQMLNVADVYDEEALRRIHPQLRFLREVDRRSGYRTRQMLALPLLQGDALRGVLQAMNHREDRPFHGLEVEAALELARSLAAAIGRHQPSARVGRRAQATRYDALANDGILPLAELDRLLALARESGQGAEQVLLAGGRVTPAQLGAALSRFFGVPYEPAREPRLRLEPLHGVLKREFVLEQGWVPLEQATEGLVVMCLDPEAVRASRLVPQVFPRAGRPDLRVTTQAEFARTVDQLYGAGPGPGAAAEAFADDLSVPLEDQSLDAALESAAADNELVKFVNKLIVDAHQQRASDIHIEPQPGRGKVGIRLRVDGVLRPYAEVPASFRQALVTRIKIMCDLDISERRRPQDGKIRFRRFGPLDIELRVATLPTAGGVEDVVIRLLASGEPQALERLDLSAGNLARLLELARQPHGLFYVCGPTGSGKTTTLHSILRELNTPAAKIWTAEDPVEITQKGLRQVQVNRKAGIDFAVLMRAFLRADPDVIMVGESRDRETVAMGVEASLTGHLVLSTLHTNSAPESIVRLLDMGMDPFNFADALLGVLAQRLARRLCDCKQPQPLEGQALEAFLREYAQELAHTPGWQADPQGQAQRLREQWLRDWGQQGRLRLWRPVGCPRCQGSGYHGRLALHELLVADRAVKRLVQARAPVPELLAAGLAAGLRTLRMDGMEKCLQGLTDLAQVRLSCLK